MHLPSLIWWEFPKTLPGELSRRAGFPLLREKRRFRRHHALFEEQDFLHSGTRRLLESVCQHASSALNNALTFEKTKESALVDPLTELTKRSRILHDARTEDRGMPAHG